MNAVRGVKWLAAWALGLGLATSANAQTTVRYVHTDSLGSVVALTDQNRVVVERREYEPYGQQLTPAVADGSGYTGHVQDAASGLTYMQQRYYDPASGRFLSVDPVAADPTSGALFNRYGYANNNPYRFVDLDGREYGAAFRSVNNATNGGPVMAPPRSPDDWLGPAIGVGLTVFVAAPIAIEAGFVVLANPATTNSLLLTALDVGAGDAIGSASFGVGVALTAKQAANLLRFEKSLPNANRGVNVDSFGDGVIFTASVPGNIPGSQAVYQKVVDAAGDTAGLVKTTVDPKGNIVHIKDKMNNTELEAY